jgi:hypothetical protein
VLIEEHTASVLQTIRTSFPICLNRLSVADVRWKSAAEEFIADGNHIFSTEGLRSHTATVTVRLLLGLIHLS